MGSPFDGEMNRNGNREIRKVLSKVESSAGLIQARRRTWGAEGRWSNSRIQVTLKRTTNCYITSQEEDTAPSSQKKSSKQHQMNWGGEEEH